MAEPNELENPFLPAGLLDVLCRFALQEGRPQSLGYLVASMLVTARGLETVHAVVETADTEANWRDLRELGVELSALSLRILQTIDRQNNLRRAA